MSSHSLRSLVILAVATAPLLLGACGGGEGKAGEEASAAQADAMPTDAQLRDQAKALFGTLPAEVPNEKNPVTGDKVALGRMLYHDVRLSKNHDVSCQTCHKLEAFGIDGTPVSTGHKGAKGDRNAPTVYNAALHATQFWDGRAADVEEQAKGPVLNPVEMAMADEASTVAVLQSIPGYVEAFEKVFPGEGVTYDNMGKAIGAFERRLTTPDALDAFINGKDDALSTEAKKGLSLFITSGCTTCHSGPAIGGRMFQKLGLLKPYETADLGRFKETQQEADKYVFKVPGLRNIAKTAPYMHDGSIASLEEMVDIMVKHQVAKGSFTGEERKSIIAFLESLTGTPPPELIDAPELPKSGPETPAPDPS